MIVPFNKAEPVGCELTYIQDAIRRGGRPGNGYYMARCSQWLRAYLKAKTVLITPSCTHALELAYMVLKIKPGDEVIVPSFTFPSTANAFVLRGARPRFIDIRSDTLNLDERLIEKAISPKTRAITVVHYAGVPCQMDVIMRIARKHGLPVIEDAAQALGATFQGKPVGSLGNLSAFSFHKSKHCFCGEGGALVADRKVHSAPAEIYRQNGTDRSLFIQGGVAQYTWVDEGSSFLPSELQCAFLLAQLEHLESIRKKRKKRYETYLAAFQGLEARGDIQLPVIPSDRTSSYHLFHVLFENEKTRNRVMNQLRKKGISAYFHYFPLHLSRMGRRYGYKPGQFPVSESANQRLLRLPLYNTMTVKEQAAVINALIKSL